MRVLADVPVLPAAFAFVVVFVVALLVALAAALVAALVATFLAVFFAAVRDPPPFDALPGARPFRLRCSNSVR